MNFDYIASMCDSLNEQALSNDTFITTATVYIAGEEVGEESFYSGVDKISDGRKTKSLKTFYPEDLDKTYRIKVYPIEKSGLRLTQNEQYDYKPVGYISSSDLWVSCLANDIKVRENNNIFDFVDYVSIEGINYRIKGIVKENIGSNPVVHVFLVKQDAN